MKISHKCDYALKIILDLSEYYQLRKVHLSEIAERQDIPENFLEQIIRFLKKGGFIESKKGPNGGYFLTKSPKEILLGEIIRYIEGTIFPISCADPNGKCECDFIPKCAFLGIWKDIGDAINKIIDSYNFEQLLQQTLEMREGRTFTYCI